MLCSYLFQCCDQKPYPTNTYAAPSHVPGKKGSVPFLGGAPPYSHMDYSGFDIVKVSAPYQMM